jgi:hypothetical protein
LAQRGRYGSGGFRRSSQRGFVEVIERRWLWRRSGVGLGG